MYVTAQYCIESISTVPLFQALTSLVAQMVKHLSTMWKTQVRSLGWEDPLEKEMAIHSRTIAWKIPWTEEPGRLQPMGLQRVGHDWATSLPLCFRGKCVPEHRKGRSHSPGISSEGREQREWKSLNAPGHASNSGGLRTRGKVSLDTCPPRRL